MVLRLAPFTVFLLCAIVPPVFGQDSDSTVCRSLPDSTRQNTVRPIDSLIRDNVWCGGIALAYSEGSCRFTDLYISNKDLSKPAVTSLEMSLAFGKKDAYITFGFNCCRDGVGEAINNDTIHIATQKFAPPRWSLTQLPLIAHYRCDLANWISLGPEAGITYVAMKRTIRGFDANTNAVTADIHDNTKTICPQFGGNVTLSIPSFFGKSSDSEGRILLEGRYDRLSFDGGMSVIQTSIGYSQVHPSRRHLHANLGIFFRECQSDKLLVKQLGLFGEGFFQLQ